MKTKTAMGEMAHWFILISAAVLVFGVCGAYAGGAQTVQDPLLQVLIKKGILTPQEAAQIKAEADRLAQQQKQEVVKEASQAAAKEASIPKSLKGLSISGLGYIHYDVGMKPLPGDREDSFNEFTLGRGYLTVKKKINPWMSGRITMDLTRKHDGDWEYRLKYLYAELDPRDMGFFTNMKMEIGQGHNPWLDFQEHVNPYRAQGTMAIERAGVFNSADLGVSLRGFFGGKLPDAKAKTGNPHYAGLYGSWHLGVYNGSGYHQGEVNGNKAFEARVTVRPLPYLIPGLQISYLGMFGEGAKKYNDDSPDYMVNMGYISLENPMYILTAQYFRTTGNAAGKWVKLLDDGSIKDELETEGYSFFGRVKIPMAPRFSVFARYDHFDQDKDDDIANDTAYDLFMGGIAYDIFKGNYVMAVYQTIDYDDNVAGRGKVPSAEKVNLGDDQQFQLVYQLKF